MNRLSLVEAIIAATAPAPIREQGYAGFCQMMEVSTARHKRAKAVRSAIMHRVLGEQMGRSFSKQIRFNLDAAKHWRTVEKATLPRVMEAA